MKSITIFNNDDGTITVNNPGGESLEEMLNGILALTTLVLATAELRGENVATYQDSCRQSVTKGTEAHRLTAFEVHRKINDNLQQIMVIPKLIGVKEDENSVL